MFLDLISQTLLFFFWFCVNRSCLTRVFPQSFFFKQYGAPSTEAFVWPSFHFHNFTQRFFQRNRHLVSSVGRAPVCWAGGRGFKPRPDQHSGSFNNWEESAAVIMTSANSYTFKCSRIRTKYVGPSHSTVTYLVLIGRKRTHTTVRKEQ